MMTPRRVALASLTFLALLVFSVLPGQRSAPVASARQPPPVARLIQFGRIEISTTPGGYPLSIDGRPAGVTSATARFFDLPAGEHTFAVEFPDGLRWSRRLSVRGGKKICITLAYRPKSPGASSTERPSRTSRSRPPASGQGDIAETIFDCGEGTATKPPPDEKETDTILRSKPSPTPASTPQPTPLAMKRLPPPTPQPTPVVVEAAPPVIVQDEPPPSPPERDEPVVGSGRPRARNLPRATPPPERLPPPPPLVEGAPKQPESQKPADEKPKDEAYKIVPIFYGTDRARTGKKETGNFYGAESGELEMGTCEVSIPKTHVRGKLESPSIWRGEFKEDPKDHVVLLKLTPLDAGQFKTQFQTRLGEVKSRDVFVFIHGYNVKFVDAARRTAQLAYDLEFPGVPVLYSWPSQGTLWGYFADEGAVGSTEPHLKQFLSGLVAQADGARIHLVAHSMGNRALTRVLQLFAAENAGPIFSEVILTAPDIDAETLRDLAPDLKKVAHHITLYASSSDAALLASKEAHGGKKHRAGDTLPEIIVVSGIDSIDASGINTDMLGHSYFAEMKPVMDDIGLLLIAGKLPAERSLLEQVREAGKYWSLPGVLIRPNGTRPGVLSWTRYLTVSNIVIFVVLFMAFVAIAVWLVLRARRRRTVAA